MPNERYIIVLLAEKNLLERDRFVGRRKSRCTLKYEQTVNTRYSFQPPNDEILTVMILAQTVSKPVFRD